MTLFGTQNSPAARRGRALALCALALMICGAALAQALPERPIPFDRLRAHFPAVDVIAVGSSACHRLDTLLADTPARRARGLMFVASMPQDAGMLFAYPSPATLSIWMKNTLIPLDVLYADGEGTIMNLARGVPLSLDSMRSVRPARYVLELNAGQAAQLGLAPGARLIVFAA